MGPIGRSIESDVTAGNKGNYRWLWLWWWWWLLLLLYYNGDDDHDNDDDCDDDVVVHDSIFHSSIY
jgi:hypothetical protein